MLRNVSRRSTPKTKNRLKGVSISRNVSKLLNKNKLILDRIRGVSLDRNIHICHNTGIKWTERLINQFEDSIDWYGASLNVDFPWTFELLEKHKDEVSWESICENMDVLNNKKFYDAFHPYFAWENVSMNQKIRWTKEIINKHKNELDWDFLSSNSMLPFSEEFLAYFHKYWKRSGLSLNSTLLSNKNWNLYLSFCGIDFIDISICKNDMTVDFIEYFKDELCWQELSCNEHLPWNEGILEKYWERWDLFLMSGNSKVPWTINLMEQNEDFLNWNRPMPPSGIEMSLSANEGLPWSFELLEKFKHLWEWNEITKIKSLNWDFEHFQKYFDKLNPNDLLRNEKFYLALENHYGKENIIPFLKLLL